VPYDQRQDYLLEADIGISAHQDTIETRFAFRTRVLDYIWAGLPMLLTSGDYFADLLEQSHLGPTLPPGDIDGWTGAMLGLASNPQLRQSIKGRLATLAARFTWEKVAQPLVEYCTGPYRTARLSWWRRGLVSVLSAAYERLPRSRPPRSQS
jgi:glycosyltransferase involved in cell wall biosynthesis